MSTILALWSSLFWAGLSGGGVGCGYSASFARCAISIFWAAGWGESLGGWGRCGKHLNHFLGLPCAAGEGVGLPVSPEPFPCQALPSLGLSGVGGVAPALPLRYLRTTPFPTARPFGGLCLRGGLLVACPWLLPSGYRLLIFRGGGRCGRCLVAVWGVFGERCGVSRARLFI